MIDDINCLCDGEVDGLRSRVTQSNHWCRGNDPIHLIVFYIVVISTSMFKQTFGKDVFLYMHDINLLIFRIHCFQCLYSKRFKRIHKLGAHTFIITFT